MKKGSKPRLTARIRKGLWAIYALADVNCYDESDLLTGCISEQDRQDVMDSVSWLYNFLVWHDNRQKKEDS